MVNQEQNGNSENSLLEGRILDISSRWMIRRKISKASAWQTLQKRFDGIPAMGGAVNVDFGLLLRFAASVSLVALAAYFVFHQYDVDVFTKRGEHRLVTLPDHSTVMLNATSSLHYNKLMFYLTRNVAFHGEGFFTIVKGDHFKVETKVATVEVLGTQFNLMSADDKYEVACTEGKVRVSTNQDNKSKVLLIGGQYTSLRNGQFDEPSRVKEEKISWKNGEFYFENTSLPDVLKTLSVQYDIRIHVEIANPTDRHYTGYFTTHNLKEALDLICVPLSLEYIIVGPSDVKILSNNN